METAIIPTAAPELNLAEELKAELSALVQARLEETRTLTVVSTDEQFQSAGEQLKGIAQLRTRIESAVRPYIDFWHRGHKAHTQLLATLDGPLEARERSIKQGLARYQREKEEARRREEERLRREAEAVRQKLEEDAHAVPTIEPEREAAPEDLVLPQDPLPAVIDQLLLFGASLNAASTCTRAPRRTRSSEWPIGNQLGLF